MQDHVFVVIECERWDEFEEAWSKRVMQAFMSEAAAQEFVDKQISGADLRFEIERIDLVRI